MTGAEIESTEEALASFERINHTIRTNGAWRETNILKRIFEKPRENNNCPTERMDASDSPLNGSFINETVSDVELVESFQERADLSPTIVRLQPETNADKPTTNDKQDCTFSHDGLSATFNNCNIFSGNIKDEINCQINCQKEKEKEGEEEQETEAQTEGVEQAIDTSADEKLILETLIDLARNSNQEIKSFMRDGCTRNEEEGQYSKRKRTDIRTYLDADKKEREKSRVNLDKLYKGIEDDFRRKAKLTTSLNEKVKNTVSAGYYWRLKEDSNELKDKDADPIERDTERELPPLQDCNSIPIMIGGDVKTLYPSLDCVSTGEMAAQAVRDTEIKFGGIDYERLRVYLTISLGENILSRHGLQNIIPERSNDSTAASLTAKTNKDLSGWILGERSCTEEEKREMLALLIQINTIILMMSHVYSFGGKVFIQGDGAGIGLRASVCLARIVMCQWDSRWAKRQFHMA